MSITRCITDSFRQCFFRFNFFLTPEMKALEAKKQAINEIAECKDVAIILDKLRSKVNELRYNARRERDVWIGIMEGRIIDDDNNTRAAPDNAKKVEKSLKKLDAVLKVIATLIENKRSKLEMSKEDEELLLSLRLAPGITTALMKRLMDLVPVSGVVLSIKR